MIGPYPAPDTFTFHQPVQHLQSCFIDLRVPKIKDLLLQAFIQWEKEFGSRFYPAGNGCARELYVLAFEDLYLAVDGQAIDELTDDQLGQ